MSTIRKVKIVKTHSIFLWAYSKNTFLIVDVLYIWYSKIQRTSISWETMHRKPNFDWWSSLTLSHESLGSNYIDMIYLIQKSISSKMEEFIHFNIIINSVFSFFKNDTVSFLKYIKVKNIYYFIFSEVFEIFSVLVFRI